MMPIAPPIWWPLTTQHRQRHAMRWRFTARANAARDVTYAAASDARAEMYTEAEQRHADRLAAIQRHFGQQITSRGNPDADHAVAFVAEHDPEGLFAPAAVDPPISELVEIDYNGIKRVGRVNSNGRVAAYAGLVAGDEWSTAGRSPSTPRLLWLPSGPALGCGWNEINC